MDFFKNWKFERVPVWQVISEKIDSYSLQAMLNLDIEFTVNAKIEFISNLTDCDFLAIHLMKSVSQPYYLFSCCVAKSRKRIWNDYVLYEFNMTKQTTIDNHTNNSIRLN